MSHFTRLTAVILLTIGLLTTATGNIIEVPGSATSIQDAIDVAVTGDTVLVDSGTWHERIDFSGKALVVASRYLLSRDTSVVRSTVIDADGIGTAVIFENGEDSLAQLVGFTIRNGSDINGGGVLCDGSSPTIRGNLVIGNAAQLDGGGITVLNGGSPLVFANTIYANRCGAWGGGVYVGAGCSPLLLRNVIIDNLAGQASGELLKDRPAAANRLVLAWGEWYRLGSLPRRFDLRGGGVCVAGATGQPANPGIINNTVDGNQGGRGGGIYSYRSGPDIRNNIITSNDPTGIRVDIEGIVTHYNDVWNNPNPYQGPVEPDSWSIELDPLYLDSAAHNFELLSGSPCIDAGDPGSPLDPDETRADMGAFYHFQTRVAEPEIPVSHGNRQLRVVPNPVEHSAVIHGFSPNLKVFDATGRHVRTLAMPTVGPGLRSGVYLLVPETGPPVRFTKLGS